MPSFTHLHFHSDASLMDGLGNIETTMQIVKAKGFDSIALTDHGTLANAVSFSLAAKANGIKPILGVEGYLAIGDKIGHITLLASGYKGWQNLVRLNNLGHAGSYKRPAFTIEQLFDHNEGLILLTGCVSSPLNSLPFEEAVALGAQMKSVFEDRMWVEVMFIADVDTWSRPLQLAKALALPYVATNDVHFAEQNDAEIHPVLTGMKAGFTYNSKELWLKNGWQMTQRMKDVAPSLSGATILRLVNNSRKIAFQIEEVDLQREPSLPIVVDADDKLRKMVQAGAKKLAKTNPEIVRNPEYLKRAKYELGIIKEMGYPAYFVILEDILSTAKANGVRVGAGRGSGAGSLILYLIGITQIDPIKYGLQFERFLNPERKGMPDVDVDIDSEGRESVLEYTAKKYQAVPIATYSRYNHKSLVHDLARALRIPKDIENQAADQGPESEVFRLCGDYNSLFDLAYERLLMQIRHKGKHAGGVIITDAIVPIERVGDQLAAAWTEGRNNELSYAGIVKFDLLGLSALATLRRLETKVGKTACPPEDFSEVFKIFQSGDLAGIFQFSGSPGIRDMTLRLQPDKFEDLIAINALYRPGALDAGTAEKYPSYKISPRKVPEIFADILEETYGVVVYQEQMMGIIQVALGGTFGQADLARRIITKGGKKTDDPVHMEQLANLRERFISGCTLKGLEISEAKSWWAELETHGRYSFNKAHSTAYSWIAWETAWWKYNYPAEFYAEMLNTDPTQAQDYIAAALDADIEISMPNINESEAEWRGLGKVIYMPLSAVKFLSVGAAEAIVNERKFGKFESIANFMDRVPKSVVRGQAREGLWHIGAFAGLDGMTEELGFKGKRAILVRKTKLQAMRDHLGFIIPPIEVARNMRKLRTKGFLCGIITGKKDKESKFGPYRVYYLSPTGVFWSREVRDLEEGEILAVKVGRYGRASRIVRLLKGE